MLTVTGAGTPEWFTSSSEAIACRARDAVASAAFPEVVGSRTANSSPP